MQIAIFLYPGFTALDALVPYEVLRLLPDADLRFVSYEAGPVVADSGVLVVGATHTLAETPKPDIILLPGSSAETPTAMANSQLLSWLTQAHETSQWTLSVCSGALILAAAGILKGQPATTHWLCQKALPAFGAASQPDKRIVRSGKIMTAAGVSAGIDLALTVVGETYGREQAEIIQLLIEFDPQPPFQAGHPDKASPDVFRKARLEMLKQAQNRKNLVSIPKILWQAAINKIRD